MSGSAPPRLLVTLVVAPGMAAVIALFWYAKWLVLQGYPPLRIASVVLGIVGAIALVLGILSRRWIWRQEATARAAGEPAVAGLPRPTARDWIVSGLYGLLAFPVMSGTQNVAITQVPLAVVLIAAMAGESWRLLLARELPGPMALLSAGLSAAGLVVLALGPDAGSPGLMIVLLLVAPLVSVFGRWAWLAAVTAPQHQMVSIAFLAAAVTLQVAGLARGEVFGDAPLRSTLALGALVVVVLAMFTLDAVGLRGHRAVVRRAGVGTVLIVLVSGHAALGQTIAPATWLAGALVIVAMLLRPPPIGEVSRP